MTNPSQLRVGIVGCGYQGSVLAHTIRESNLMQLMACADPDTAAAERVTGGGGATSVFASVTELLAGSTVDAVLVATSHDALFECSLAAIEAGKHVLAEKPIGMDEREAAQLEDAVERAGVCFMAGYSFRYIPAWQRVHELLQAGVVGEIHTVTGSIGIGPMSSGWRADPASGGGPSLYVGSHLVDQALWYVGDDPIEVDANIRYRPDTHAEETALFRIHFGRGAVAQGMVTQAAAGFFHDLDIWGRQGRLSLHSTGLAYSVEVVSDVFPSYAKPATIRFPQVEDLRVQKHRAQFAEFVQAIGERRQPACTVSDGRRALKVLDAITKAGRTGQIVRLG